MKPVQHSQHFLRKRKMMLIMPLLILPFITLAFWALGGGKTVTTGIAQVPTAKGLNLQLPGANLKADNDLDKMDYYKKAEADSAKFKAKMKDDAYFRLTNSASTEAKSSSDNSDVDNDSLEKNSEKGLPVTGEAKVYAKLKQINAALDNATNSAKIPNVLNVGEASTFDVSKANKNGYADVSGSKESPIYNQNMNRLESIMKSTKGPTAGGDSEMTQINAMLEKVMDIQHPERLSEKYKEKGAEQKGPVYAVTPSKQETNGFYSVDNGDSTALTDPVSDAIQADVYETQTLVNGETVKLRLLTDVRINGVLTPKDNLIYGTASLAGERLTIAVNGIRYQNSIFPVALSVYDMDGVAGIHIPGAITRDVAKQSADNALQAIALNSLDPSLGAQAATAGIETAKTLLSKKVKLVRITLKAGYHVLLKDNNNK